MIYEVHRQVDLGISEEDIIGNEEIDPEEFDREIELEDQGRRVLSRFGYRLSHDWFLAFVKAAVIVLLLQVLIIAWLRLDGRSERGEASVLVFAPMVLVPLLPLLIIKWRYARWWFIGAIVPLAVIASHLSILS